MSSRRPEEWLRTKELAAAIAWTVTHIKGRKQLIHKGRKPTNPYRSQAWPPTA